MHELTLEQTDKIVQFVTRHEIVFSHLCDDLTDHICCDLEDSLKRGESFDDAFLKLKFTLGKNVLPNIQKDTLFAVDSKYRKMRSMIKISGVAGTILLGIATVFKILHLPLAGIMLSLGAVILITLFLPSSMIVLWKESKSAKRLFLFVSGFLASAFFIAGVLFKIQHWPGSSLIISAGILIAILLFIPALIRELLNNPDLTVPRWLPISGGVVVALYGAGFLCKIMHWPMATVLLIVSSIMLAVLILPAYFYYRWGKDDYISLEALLLIASILLFVVPTILINFDASRNFEGLFLETTTLSKRSMEFRIDRNKGLLPDTLMDEADLLSQLHIETQSLISQINEIENKIIESDNVDVNDSISKKGNLEWQPFNYEAVRRVFTNEESPIPDLENNLLAYKNLIVSINVTEPSNSQYDLLDLEQYLSLRVGKAEIEPHISPIALIQSLEALKGSILDVEAATIRNLIKKSDIIN